MNISISIVTYNNEETLLDCIDSILNFFDLNTNNKILFLDNGSQDKTVNIIKKNINKNITLIQSFRNLGYGAGHNKAIEQIESDYHIICNPDIIINRQTIPLLLTYMEKHPEIGMLCPKFLNPDGSLQPNNHIEPNFLDLALRRLAPKALKKRLKKRMEAYVMLDKGYDKVCDVPFVSGAFMFCRTSVLKEVGGFDERYFLYFEDADLSRKMHIKGYRTVYYPDATVIHKWERAAHKKLSIAWIFFVNAMRYFNKWGFKLY